MGVAPKSTVVYIVQLPVDGWTDGWLGWFRMGKSRLSRRHTREGSRVQQTGFITPGRSGAWEEMKLERGVKG